MKRYISCHFIFSAWTSSHALALLGGRISKSYCRWAEKKRPVHACELVMYRVDFIDPQPSIILKLNPLQYLIKKLNAYFSWYSHSHDSLIMVNFFWVKIYIPLDLLEEKRSTLTCYFILEIWHTQMLSISDIFSQSYNYKNIHEFSLIVNHFIFITKDISEIFFPPKRTTSISPILISDPPMFVGSFVNRQSPSTARDSGALPLS